MYFKNPSLKQKALDKSLDKTKVLSNDKHKDVPKQN